MVPERRSDFIERDTVGKDNDGTDQPSPGEVGGKHIWDRSTLCVCVYIRIVNYLLHKYWSYHGYVDQGVYA